MAEQFGTNSLDVVGIGVSTLMQSSKKILRKAIY